MIISFLIDASYTFSNSMFISYFCYICLFFRAFQHQFQQRIEKLHHELLDTDGENALRKIAIAKQHLKEAISFHIKYKKCVLSKFVAEQFFNSIFDNFSIFDNADISYGGVLFIQSICGTFYIATSIIQMELVSEPKLSLLEFWMVSISRLQALRHFDANIGLVFICVINSLFTLFLYCFFGSLATDSFSRISDCVYDSRWYELPTELKIYPIMILGNSHLPLRFYGHKIVSMNLGTFQKVRSEMWKKKFEFILFVSFQILKKVSSFYLMFRALVWWNKVRSMDIFFY